MRRFHSNAMVFIHKFLMGQPTGNFILFWKSIFWVYQKDMQCEWRRPFSLIFSLFFSIILATIYSYAIPIELLAESRNLDGLLLSSLFFSIALSTSQSFQSETETNALRIMNMSFLDPAGIYLGKLLLHWQRQLVFIFLCTPIYFLFLQGKIPLDLSRWLPLLLCLILTAFSLAALGILISYISQGDGWNQLLVPLLLLPLSLPVFFLSIDFLAQARQMNSLWEIPIRHYLVMIAPSMLYGGIGSLFYSRIKVDSM